jgi:UDP-N-acetylglucosamine 2-epimerase (non-hydrolysing)
VPLITHLQQFRNAVMADHSTARVQWHRPAPAASPLRIVSVVGTRPEAIKIAPIVLSARKLGIDHVLIATGQHGAMFRDALATFDLVRDHVLAPGSSGRTR